MAELRVALVLATSTGGVGRHVAAVARALSRHGVRVAVLGPRATNERFGFAPADAVGVDAAVRFRAVEIGSRLRPVSLAKTAAATLRLRRALRAADVVHAHGFRAAVCCALALGRWRAPASPRRPAFVVTFHNAMAGGGFRRQVLTSVMRRLARAADTALVVSPDLAADLPGAGRALVSAPVSAPVSAAAGDPHAVRRSLGIPAGAALVLAVGRLHPQKGFDVLVEAAARLKPGAVVVIAGDGPQRDELLQAIGEARVDVRLIGDRADVADLLRAADAVVMPSRWEGWPLFAGEALAAGRPLVATRVGGLPELVGDAATLVPARDPGALAEAIQRLLDDEGMAAEHALRAVKRAAQLPTDDDVTDQLLRCYRELSERPR